MLSTMFHLLFIQAIYHVYKTLYTYSEVFYSYFYIIKLLMGKHGGIYLYYQHSEG